MNPTTLLHVRRLLLFQAALRDADTPLLHSLQDNAAALDPRRRKLLATELARRASAESVAWIAPLLGATTITS